MKWTYKTNGHTDIPWQLCFLIPFKFDYWKKKIKGNVRENIIADIFRMKNCVVYLAYNFLQSSIFASVYNLAFAMEDFD